MFRRLDVWAFGRLALLVAFLFPLPSSLFPVSANAETSEIMVDLKLDSADFVTGERIRGVVDIANPSPTTIGRGTFVVTNKENREIQFKLDDRVFVEVFRASDMRQLTKVSRHAFVADFYVRSSEGQKLEVFLGDHYGLREPSRYLAKPVLVHNGVRYEGTMRAFDVVDGVRLGGGMQMFANRNGLRREFELVYWSRRNSEHLFLRAKDAGISDRIWETRDLGPMLRIDKPSISVMPKGEVVVLHRLNQDQFVRSEFWSLPDALEFRIRESVRDPETAGTARVRELYKEGGIKPKENSWWKFW